MLSNKSLQSLNFSLQRCTPMGTIRNNSIAFVHHHTYFWARFGARIASDCTLRLLSLQKSDFSLQKVSPLGRVISVGPYGCPAPERDVWSRIGMRLGSTTRENRFCPISGLPDFQFTIKNSQHWFRKFLLQISS